MGRIRLMAQTGGKTQTLRLAALMVGGVFVLYLLWGWLFG
jgi:blocked-early-in-transport protein 1